jgi:hypothetical protein
MKLWKLKGYITSRGANIVNEWCANVADEVWMAFAFNMDYLAGQPIQNWKRPWSAVLGGSKRGRKKGCSGLVEIIFEVGNVQYRPLGYFSGNSEFTFVFFAEERGDEFDPPTACAIAKSHIAIIEADKERAREFVIEENIGEEDSSE